MTKVYTLQDFTVNKDRCKHHAQGYWQNHYMYEEKGYYINYSDVLTELIQTAGRFCEQYASDLFIIWNCLLSRLEDKDYKGEKLILGFREQGVDKNERVIENCNRTGDIYYRKIHVVEIVVNGNRIDMYMN